MTTQKTRRTSFGLTAHIDRATKSLDAAVFVGGSLLYRRYGNLQRAAERGVRIRFLLANPRIGWIDELLRPTGTDSDEYLHGLHINASRVLMLGEVAEARWQPFPIPWWFAIVDNNVVHLRAINMVGRPPGIQIVDAAQVKYYRELFSSAWEKAESVAESWSRTATTKSALRVFLCHSSADKPQVRTLYRRLVEDGVSPWLDEEALVPGQDWEFEISRAIQQSDIILICMSNHSVDKRGYVQREIRYAMRVADEVPKGQIFLIPARLEPCDIPDDMRRLQWVDLFDPKGYRRLLRALQIPRQR